MSLKKVGSRAGVVNELPGLVPENFGDLVPAMIVVYNIKTGEYIYANKSAKKILGYRPEDFITKGLEFVASLVHPDDFQPIMAANQAALDAANKTKSRRSDKEPILNFEYRMRHAKGRWVWLHTAGSVFNRDMRGRVEHVINISVDITRRKEAENKLKEMSDRLEARVAERSAKLKTAIKSSQQLASLNRAKDDFLSLASHQLRTPATAVKQYVGMLLEGYVGQLTGDQLTLVRLAQESNERQINIINDLLNVARIDAGKVKLAKQPTDLVTMLYQIISEQTDKVQAKRQSVIFDHPYGKIYSLLDRERMHMVFDNILDNAIKYTPEGKRIYINIVTEPTRASVEISDEGVGIARKDTAKVFQKFSRIDNPLSTVAGGTGLGMYWAQKIVYLHGGSIDIKSKLGKGTKFSVSIPGAPKRSASLAPDFRTSLAKAPQFTIKRKVVRS